MLVPILVALGLVWLLIQVQSIFTIDDGSMDKLTELLLEGTNSVPAECEPVVAALEEASVLDDECGCADQIRTIVASGSPSYTT